MAGWTLTPLPYNWQKYVYELFEATNERADVVNKSLLTAPTTGDPIQSAYGFWGPLQAKVKSIADEFVQSHDLAGAPLTDYDDQSDIPHWTLATLFESIGAPAATTNFRRTTTKYSDITDWTDWTDPAFSIGSAQPGDVIGPWIIADLQAALDRLIWVDKDSVDGFIFTDEYSTIDIDETGHASRTDAITAADAAFAAAIPSTGSSSVKTPEMVAVINNSWAARIDSEAVTYKATGLSTTIAAAVDFYIKAVAPTAGDTNEFDANGEDVIQDKYSLWETLTAATGETRISTGYIGSTANQPTWPSTPTAEPPPATDVYRGWKESNKNFIARFDVSGGFVYY